VSKAEIYAEQYDHQWIARFGICPAELEESGDVRLQELYLVGLWAWLTAKGLQAIH